MSERLRVGEKVLDLKTGGASDGQQLRPLELAVLRYLATHPGEVISLDQLLVDVWGDSPCWPRQAPARDPGLCGLPSSARLKGGRPL